MQNMAGSQRALALIIYPVFVVGIRIKVLRHLAVSVVLFTYRSSQQGLSFSTVLEASCSHMLFVMFNSIQWYLYAACLNSNHSKALQGIQLKSSWTAPLVYNYCNDSFYNSFWGIIIRPNRMALLYLAAYMEQTDASLLSQWWHSASFNPVSERLSQKITESCTF